VGAGALSAVFFWSAVEFWPTAVVLAVPFVCVAPVPIAIQRLRAGATSAWLGAALAAALVAASRGLPAAGFYLPVLAPLLLGESLARGRGLLRGCAWAFGALVAVIGVGLLFLPQAMADFLVAPLDHVLSEAFLSELKSGGLTPEQIAQFTSIVGTWRDVFAIVFPALWVISAAVQVAVNAGLLRLYLLRRDPGWLEDGEFERVRWPLALVAVFVLSGAGVALPLSRAAAYNVLLVTAFFFILQGLAVVAFYVRRLAGPPLLRLAIMVLVLANPWAPQILALLGLFDNWFDFRRWAEPPPEGDGTRPGRPA
jgi:hypothetical protein